jgi:hypothetical protein
MSDDIAKFACKEADEIVRLRKDVRRLWVLSIVGWACSLLLALEVWKL